MNVDPGVLSSIVVGAGLLITTTLTNRNNRRGQDATNELESRRVSVTEFEAHKVFMTEQMDDLKADLKAEREDRRAAEGRAVSAEERASEAERRAGVAEQRAGDAEQETRRIAARVTQLEDAMKRAQLVIPPPMPTEAPKAT